MLDTSTQEKALKEELLNEFSDYSIEDLEKAIKDISYDLMERMNSEDEGDHPTKEDIDLAHKKTNILALLLLEKQAVAELDMDFTYFKDRLLDHIYESKMYQNYEEEDILPQLMMMVDIVETLKDSSVDGQDLLDSVLDLAYKHHEENGTVEGFSILSETKRLISGTDIINKYFDKDYIFGSDDEEDLNFNLGNSGLNISLPKKLVVNLPGGIVMAGTPDEDDTENGDDNRFDGMTDTEIADARLESLSRFIEIGAKYNILETSSLTGNLEDDILFYVDPNNPCGSIFDVEEASWLAIHKDAMETLSVLSGQAFRNVVDELSTIKPEMVDEDSACAVTEFMTQYRPETSTLSQRQHITSALVDWSGDPRVKDLIGLSASYDMRDSMDLNVDIISQALVTCSFRELKEIFPINEAKMSLYVLWKNAKDESEMMKVISELSTLGRPLSFLTFSTVGELMGTTGGTLNVPTTWTINSLGPRAFARPEDFIESDEDDG